MQRIPIVVATLLLVGAGFAAGPVAAATAQAAYDQAKRAIAAGNVVPERDLAPLLQVLRAPSSPEELSTAIDKVETLGDAQGSSPAAVKHYLLEQATPAASTLVATTAAIRIDFMSSPGRGYAPALSAAAATKYAAADVAEF